MIFLEYTMGLCVWFMRYYVSCLRATKAGCWGIHVATEATGEILKIIKSLNCDVHEYTNTEVEWSTMWFINLFQLFSNERCIHEECIFKWCIHWKGLLIEFYFIFCLCYQYSWIIFSWCDLSGQYWFHIYFE